MPPLRGWLIAGSTKSAGRPPAGQARAPVPTRFSLSSLTRCDLCSRLRGHARSSLRLIRGGGCGGGFVQDAVVNGEYAKLKTNGDSDFVVDIAQVVLDDLLSRAKLRGDFFV